MSNMSGVRFPLRNVKEVAEWEALTADQDEGVRVFESTCPQSAEVDHMTAYVSERTRMVVLIVDFSGFAPARVVPQTRRCVRGNRQGSYAGFLETLQHLGLTESTEASQ